MKYILVCFAFLFASCNNSTNNFKDADNAIDAGREFIDACLKGDFVKADFYMLQDEENKANLNKIERGYREKDRDGRRQYREASIIINEVANLTETTAIINYSNSYDKIAHKIKVVEINNKWLVDFKYTFNPNL